MEQDTPSQKTNYKKFTVKELIFFLVSGALLVPAGYFWKNLITTGVSTQPIDYVLPIAATIGFSVAFVLTSVLATARWLGWVIFPLAVSGTIVFVPLWQGNYAIALIAAMIVSLSLIYALYTTRASYENSATFQASRVIKAGLSGVLSAIALLMSFYYLNAQLSKPADIIPAGLIEGVVSFTSKQTGTQLPKTLNQQITETIKTQIDRLIEPYKPLIPYIFTVLFFLSVRSLTFILSWLIVPLASIVLKFLIEVGIVYKKKVQIEAERVFL